MAWDTTVSSSSDSWLSRELKNPVQIFKKWEFTQHIQWRTALPVITIQKHNIEGVDDYQVAARDEYWHSGFVKLCNLTFVQAACPVNLLQGKICLHL